jgi:hypothetical protein
MQYVIKEQESDHECTSQRTYLENMSTPWSKLSNFCFFFKFKFLALLQINYKGRIEMWNASGRREYLPTKTE